VTSPSMLSNIARDFFTIASLKSSQGLNRIVSINDRLNEEKNADNVHHLTKKGRRGVRACTAACEMETRVWFWAGVARASVSTSEMVDIAVDLISTLSS
jgi:hypothetical protein